jgi:Flp pilus assembly protein TadB
MGQRADADLRASDAERNEVADKLSRHYADGRLDQTEFKARLDRAMGATTRGDLDGLFDDLPRLVTEPPSPPRHRRRMVPFIIILVLIAVAAGSTASVVHVPWLLLVVIALFLWSRAGWRRHRPRSHSDP